MDEGGRVHGCVGDGWVGVNGWMDRGVNSGSAEGWVSG